MPATDWLSQNLSLLTEKLPHIGQSLIAMSPMGVQIVAAKNGLPNLLEQDSQGNWQPLHSRYDPLREARERAQSVVLEDQTLCVLFGFGAGYLLDVLLELPLAAHHHFLVVEPNLSLFRCALSCRDLQPVLKRSNVHWHIGTGPFTLTGLEHLPKEHFLKPPLFLSNFASLRLWKTYYEQTAEQIKNEIRNLHYQIHNLTVAAPMFFENFLKNLLGSLWDPGIRELANTFQNVPAIIVGAGPSLDKNLSQIVDASRSAVLIATDASAKCLKAANLEPHFIVTIDPQEICHHHLRGLDAVQSCLVYEASSHPANPALFPGRRFISILENSVFSFLWDQVGNRGSISGWGSVSTVAFHLALHMGCRPILFAGQDLAYTQGRAFAQNVEFQKAHRKDVHSEEELLARYEAHCRNSKDLIQWPDLFHRLTLSTQRLKAYGEYLSQTILAHGDIPCYNVTEGGILQAGVEQMSMKEALFRFCQKEEDLWARIPSCDSYRISTKRVEQYLKEFFLQARDLEQETGRAIRKLEGWLATEIPGQTVTYESVHRWWEAFLGRAARFQHVWGFLELFMQKTIFEFSRAESAVRGDAAGEARRCLPYLQGISENAGRYLPPLQAFLQDLKNAPSRSA